MYFWLLSVLMIFILQCKPKEEQSAISSTWGNNSTPWPNGIVPYVFERNVPLHIQHRVHTAARRVTEQSEKIVQILPIQMAKKEGFDTTYFVTISFNTDSKCHATRGVYFNKPDAKKNFNIMSLSERCHVGNIMHEFMHLLGFAHEQNNPEAKIEIIRDRIEGPYLKQYQNFGDMDLTPHDTYSIMHYDSWKWSICSNPKAPKWNVLLKRSESERKNMPHISCRTKSWWDLTADKNNGIDCRKECEVFTLESGKPLHSNRIELSPDDIRGIRQIYVSLKK